jgi:hypothetical protein
LTTNDELRLLCDDLWAGGERLHASQLYLAAFTGFGPERALQTLNELRGLRADGQTVERLGLGKRLHALIAAFEDALDPFGPN